MTKKTPITLGNHEAKLERAQGALSSVVTAIDETGKQLALLEAREELTQPQMLEQENFRRKLKRLGREKTEAAAGVESADAELLEAQRETNREAFAESVASLKADEAELLALVEKLEAELAARLTSHLALRGEVDTLAQRDGVDQRPYREQRFGSQTPSTCFMNCQPSDALEAVGKVLRGHQRSIEEKKQAAERESQRQSQSVRMSPIGEWPSMGGAPGPNTKVLSYNDAGGRTITTFGGREVHIGHQRPPVPLHVPQAPDADELA
jgi:hypothetical protein